MLSRLKHPKKSIETKMKELVAFEFAFEMTVDSPSSGLFSRLLKLYKIIEYITINSTDGVTNICVKKKNE